VGFFSDLNRSPHGDGLFFGAVLPIGLLLLLPVMHSNLQVLTDSCGMIQSEGMILSGSRGMNQPELETRVIVHTHSMCVVSKFVCQGS
jgi:hypothetical protein